MPASELIGEEYFSKTPNNTGEGEVFADKVTRKELKALQTEIATVIRPPYCQGPPSNLGNPGHGKLKADQWKTCMEFDLPIFIAQNWARETSAAGQDPEITARRDKVYENIMQLAVAIRWGTSYKTSAQHSQKFEENLVLYLRSLLILYPDIKFRPNHHASLHIGPLLAQFGPVHGWWMFPFERIIGLLQKINTNNKMGKCT
jgi:hypothetical protein